MTFAAEMRRARDRVAAVPSNTLTTRWGAVEFVDEGRGVPLLISHGVLGGHDNIRDLTDLWVGHDYRAIGPSRFGYLGSAMPDNATPADQADSYAALLDHLDAIHCKPPVASGSSSAVAAPATRPTLVNTGPPELPRSRSPSSRSASLVGPTAWKLMTVDGLTVKLWSGTG
jgi:hypothetical protein